MRLLAQVAPRLLVRLAVIGLLGMSSGGCVSVKLKQQEILRLETELTAINNASSYLATQPTLGSGYDGRLFVSGDALNRFLAGLDRYEVPIEVPKGAKIRFEEARLQFQDGMPVIDVSAVAVDRTGHIEVKLKLRSDLVIETDPAESAMKVRLKLREVVPDIRFSIFHLRRSWFAAYLLMREGQAHIDALPAISVPLKADLPIDFDPPDKVRLEIEHGWIDAYLKAPKLSFDYKYRVVRVLPLQDGIHMFFALERVR